MGFWDLIFGKNTGQSVATPKIRFGRYTDSYKEKAQYESWDKALDKFEANDYLESYKEFFKYLRDDKEDNVRWAEENGGIHFEILQGSKRVSGFADARQLKAEARIANAKELSVAFMRRLVEANYSLDYCRFALDDENNLVVKFDTFTLDGSPYKLYYALKEVAMNADKQDDLLLDEFDTMLTWIDTGSKTDIIVAEKEAKFNFIQEQVKTTLEEIEKGSLNGEKYPGGISYLLLSAVYKIDFLTTPEGFLMEIIERTHRSYFDGNDGKTMIQKNVSIRKELDKILNRPKELIFNELYSTSSTFGIVAPKGHDALVGLIDGELANMDWYEANNHTKVALSIPGYIMGNALFNFALPKPSKDFIELYYRITESKYFTSLGFTPAYFDESKGIYDQKSIKNAIRKVVEAHKEKFPQLSADLNILDFKNPCHFVRTYLLMLKSLDITPKS
jgi:hypothetical protein